jgi:hypothetical protein
MEWLQFQCGYRGHARLWHEEATWYRAFEMVQKEEITLSPSKLELNPFPLKQ